MLMGISVFSACNKTGVYTVKFMVDGAQYATADINDGAVALPENPSKTYYDFRGWYTDESRNTEFTNKDVKSNTTVYALFVAKTVDVSVDGGAAEEKTLEEVATGTYAPRREGLTFDGWYTDAAYQTKYATQSVDALYGRFMAKITFNNGYEDVYTALAVPGEAFGGGVAPTTERVKKFYMDDKDISYVDGDGNAIANIATKTFDANQTVTVLWRTPFLKYEETDQGDLTCKGIDNSNITLYRSFPALSVLSNITYNGESRRVTGISLLPVSDALNTIIIGEGVKQASNACNGSLLSAGYNVERIVLPSSLVIIQSSFSGLGLANADAIEFSDGGNLKIIINSFWVGESDSLNRQRKGYNFDIEIPASVINLSQAPDNFVFPSNSIFTNDGNGRIYKTDSDGNKILITDTNVDANGRLTVEDGVDGIQVGAFFYFNTYSVNYLKYLSLPASFSMVSYNEPLADYSDFYTSNYLYDPNGMSTPDEYMALGAYSIVNEIEKIDYIAIDQTAYPANVNRFALGGDNYQENPFKIVFIGEVAPSGPVAVNIISTNTMTNEIRKYSIDAVSGGTLTREDILTAAGITESYLTATSIRQFGEDYFAAGETSATVSRNQYIHLYFKYTVTGFTYSANGDGTATVTGFDSASAHRLASGMYLVVIPNEFDGVRITAIGDEAFRNNHDISHIFIGDGITAIGERAFMNASNLYSINITAGGLQTIGRSAFENVGCVWNAASQQYVVNTQFSSIPECRVNTSRYGVQLKLPVAALTYVGPYAFKSRAVFLQPAAGEENRSMSVTYQNEAGTTVSRVSEEAVAGAYFLIKGPSAADLVRFMETNIAQQPTLNNPTVMIDITVYDVQLIAISGNGTLSNIGMGDSGRRFSYAFVPKDLVTRYEIMEGSVYFLDNRALTFGIVSKVHKNAFTDISNYIKTAFRMVYDCKTRVIDNWLALEQITSVVNANYVFANDGETDYGAVSKTTNIFCDGWFEGIMHDDPHYADLLAFMSGYVLMDGYLN
jgi:Listeria-Bacteroides repeat domain (List_Bact_rpt).